MICLQVENLTVEGFIEIINTQQFDLDELDEFIRKFYLHIRNTAMEASKAYSKQLDVIKKAEQKSELKKEYEKVMDSLDEFLLLRKEKLEKLEYKYKYKGKYGSRKGATCNSAVKKHRINITYEQLRIM
jgi:hypothetical protein